MFEKRLDKIETNARIKGLACNCTCGEGHRMSRCWCLVTCRIACTINNLLNKKNGKRNGKSKTKK